MEGFERVRSHSTSSLRRQQMRVSNHKILLSDDISDVIGPRADLFINRAETFCQIAVVGGKEFTVHANSTRKQRGYVYCRALLDRVADQYDIADTWYDAEPIEGGYRITIGTPKKSKQAVQVDVRRA